MKTNKQKTCDKSNVQNPRKQILHANDLAIMTTN